MGMSDLPLAINMIGPMVFKLSGDVIDVWMPKLDEQDFPHQAGIGSNVDSLILTGDQSDYSLTDPNPQEYAGDTMFFNPPNGTSVPYQVQGNIPTEYNIHVTLPKPKWMIGLSPIACEIYHGKRTESYLLRPVGFRLLYEKAGAPVLISSQGVTPPYPVVFDPTSDEKLLEMFISYAPINSDDPATSAGVDHPEAKDDFHRLAAMIGLDLDIYFQHSENQTFRLGRNVNIFNGPLQNCKAANITLI